MIATGHRNGLPPIMKTLQDYEPLYRELEAILRREKWFTKKWDAKTGLHPDSQQPKSLGIQVYKDTWFNEEGRGIHFESWMTNADIGRGTASVVLHIESSKERTGINGKALVTHLFENEGERIASWEGYAIKQSYTMQPFIRKVCITPETLVSQLQKEFSRLEKIAGAIDQAILAARKTS